MIKNAVVVGEDTSPAKYNGLETEQRGSALFTVRSHVLQEILRNAQRWVKGYVSPQTKAMEFGSLLDCVLLTPWDWPKRYAVLPSDAPRRPSERQRNAKKQSDSSKEAIAFWDDFAKKNPGEIISQELNAAAHAAANRIREDPLLADLIDSSKKQVMLVAEWHDEPTGLMVPLKCLIDLVPNKEHPIFSNALYDLKTTSNASKRSFKLDAQKYRYDLQGALYRDVWNAATGEGRTDFGHLIVESYHPYEFRSPPPNLAQRVLDFGRLSYERAFHLYCRGVTTGKWKGYDENDGTWPITDFDDWALNMEQIYDPMPESEPEPEPEPESEKDEVTP